MYANSFCLHVFVHVCNSAFYILICMYKWLCVYLFYDFNYIRTVSIESQWCAMSVHV